MTTYEIMELEHTKLLEISEAVLPDKMRLNVWGNYVDILEQIAKCIKEVIKQNN